jgi:hypothetical protein
MWYIPQGNCMTLELGPDIGLVSDGEYFINLEFCGYFELETALAAPAARDLVIVGVGIPFCPWDIYEGEDILEMVSQYVEKFGVAGVNIYHKIQEERYYSDNEELEYEALVAYYYKEYYTNNVPEVCEHCCDFDDDDDDEYYFADDAGGCYDFYDYYRDDDGFVDYEFNEE